MRAREAIGFLVAVLSVVVLTIQTVIAFLVGAEVEEVGGTVLIGLGALGWLIYTRRSLKKQGSRGGVLPRRPSSTNSRKLATRTRNLASGSARDVAFTGK